MKILIDIGHPAHVHYFKNLIHILKENGHSFLIIARDKEITHQLLNAYNIPFETRGKGKNNLFGKMIYTLKADFKIFRQAIKWKPDMLLSFGSPYAAHVSKLLNKPHVSITDTEHAKLGILAFVPFTKTILTPDVFTKDFGEKQIRFQSYIELAYLHRNYFKPNLNIKNELGLTGNQKIVVFRFISWGASHDIGQSGIPDEIKKNLIHLFLEKNYKVIISSEGKLDKHFEPYKMKISPENIHSLLYASDFFIGESGTMATEAALLGIPSVFVNSLNAGVFEDEVKYKVLYSFRNADGLENKIQDLLNNENLKRLHQINRDILLENKIDITAFLVWFIENYPLSISLLKSNPQYQSQFK